MKLKCTVDLELIVNFESTDVEKNCEALYDRVSGMVGQNFKQREVDKFDTTIKIMQNGSQKKTTANNG